MKKWSTGTANEEDLSFFQDLFPEINRIYVEHKGNSAHEAVLKSFFLSRLALQRALKKTDCPVPWQDFVWEKHGKLSNAPDHCVSISHTSNYAVAVAALRSDFQSIGVDVERADRAMKLGSERFYISDADNHHFSPLEMWTVKEAAFKAYSPLFPDLRLMKNILIDQRKTIYQGISGEIDLTANQYITSVITIL